MRTVPIAWGFVLCLGLGCDDAGSGGVAPPAPAPAPTPVRCPVGEAAKLGIPFVPLCDPAAPVAEPMWISASALACTGGEHEVVGCPPGTPLVAIPPTTRTREARSVALMEGETAFRTCALRFGGRLPTTAERERARRVQGLATLVASRATEGDAIELDETPEWVADGRCDNPSFSGTDCAVRRYPIDAAPNVPWNLTLRCSVVVGAGTTRTDGLVAELGGTCPTHGDCLMRSPIATRDEVVTLRCAPSPVERYPADTSALGATRCVVPRHALSPL